MAIPKDRKHTDLSKLTDIDKAVSIANKEAHSEVEENLSKPLWETE